MEELFIVDSQGVRRRGIEVPCQVCKELLVRVASRTKEEGRYYHPECYKNSRTTQVIELACSFCSKPLKRSKGHLLKSKSGLYFCNRKCKEKAQSLSGGISAIQPSHYGMGEGEWSYRDKVFSTRGRVCEKCGYNEIPEVIQVHHRDSNRKNNKDENLHVLCPTCHEVEHFKAGTGRYGKKSKGGEM